ncbi:MAG TPA: hypothetical protein VKT83_17890 [bacterium]|nr:hypothetical protein [bacterium]
MDPQTPEILRERVSGLKRRLRLAVVGLLAVTVSLVVGVLAQNVRAQPNPAQATGDQVTTADLEAIQRQVNEFRGELAAYGVRLTAVEEELRARTPAPTGPVTAQKPGGYWTVITTKMRIFEGRGLMQVMGPFPSPAMCDATLNGILGGLREQGIAVESSACRQNITIAVPK